MTLLPEDTQPSEKHQRRSTKPLLWMLILLLILTLGSITVIIGVQPGLLGLMRESDFTLTQSAVEGIISALNLTHVALQSTGQFHTGREIELQSTQAALVNAANRIIQTETQQSVNNSTTQTAIAVSNAQQATQAAIDFASTQTALNAIGTQVQLNYQATRESLNRVLTSTPLQNTQSNIFILNENFTSGVETSITSQLPPSGVWGILRDGVLLAQADNATLISGRQGLTNYTFTLDIVPSQVGNYDILLNVLGNEALPLVLRLVYDGRQITSARVTPFNFDTIASGVIPDEGLTLGAATPLEIIPTPLTVRVTAADSIYTVTINGSRLFDFVYPAGGTIGLQVPTGTQIRQFNFN
jgi:hypothetical protein